MGQPTLPLEIYSIIYGYLTTDLQALKNSCFLNRGLTEICQPHIFRSIVLRAERSSGPLPDTICFKFHRLLCVTPRIARYVQNLTVYDVDPFDSMETPGARRPPRISYVTQDVCLPYALDRLPSLTHLALWVVGASTKDDDSNWDGFSATLQAAFMRTVQSPRLVSIKFRAVTGLPIELMRACRTLKHLELLYCDFRESDDYVDHDFDPVLDDMSGMEYQSGDEMEDETGFTGSEGSDASDEGSNNGLQDSADHDSGIISDSVHVHNDAAGPASSTLGDHNGNTVEEDWGDDSEDGSYIPSIESEEMDDYASDNQSGDGLGLGELRPRLHQPEYVRVGDLPKIQLETFASVLDDSRILIGKNSPFDLTCLKSVAIWISLSNTDEYPRWNKILHDNADTVESLRFDCLGDCKPPPQIKLCGLTVLRSLEVIIPIWIPSVPFTGWVSHLMHQFDPEGPLRSVTIVVMFPHVTELVSPEYEEDHEWSRLDRAFSRLPLLDEVRIWLQPQTGDARNINGLSLVEKKLGSLHKRGILAIERVANHYHTRDLSGYTVVHP